MKLFHCSSCNQRVFFENTRCENCGSNLGFVPQEKEMVAFSADESWNRLGSEGAAQRQCANYAVESVCNWMLDASDPATLCVSCRTTAIIPALGKAENRTYWALLEQAKRRLFYTLLGLNLPGPGKDANPRHGMSFHFLEETSPQQRVFTGHEEGVITLNIAEADDALREKERTRLHEPYRSLVGHFRHESGHYYWDRLIRNSSSIGEYRQIFGDERVNYDEALRCHYSTPLVDWHLNYISAYASSHPWEDWSECWAHYLHMIDGLETAAAWGLRLDHATPGAPPLRAAELGRDADSMAAALIEQWLPISQFINSMNRSLGLHDSYPFIVRAPVVAKLEFIHRVIGTAIRAEVTMDFAPAGEPALEPASN